MGAGGGGERASSAAARMVSADVPACCVANGCLARWRLGVWSRAVCRLRGRWWVLLSSRSQCRDVASGGVGSCDGSLKCGGDGGGDTRLSDPAGSASEAGQGGGEARPRLGRRRPRWWHRRGARWLMTVRGVHGFVGKANHGRRVDEAPGRGDARSELDIGVVIGREGQELGNKGRGALCTHPKLRAILWRGPGGPKGRPKAGEERARRGDGRPIRHREGVRAVVLVCAVARGPALTAIYFYTYYIYCVFEYIFTVFKDEVTRTLITVRSTRFYSSPESHTHSVYCTLRFHSFLINININI